MKIAFVGMMSLLDYHSGAALSVRGFLETLATRGHECLSYSATSFDRRAEVPLEDILGPGITTASARGRTVVRELNGVSHHVFVTSRTHRSGVQKEEWIAMAQNGQQWLRDVGADVVITYGANPITAILQREARDTGAQMVFYLANAEWRDRSNIQDSDRVICPSQFLADHYRATLGLQADVVRTVIPQQRFLTGEERLFASEPQRRQEGFVTFMNPQPVKGIGLVARLVDTLAEREPALRFLIVSGRLDTDAIRFNGKLLSERANVQCSEFHRDVREIYRRTAILLLPSVWQEGASRAIVEAQLSAIPVIASNRGGNRERLNGGGYCLDLPPRLIEDNRVIPSESDIEPWCDTLLQLWCDEAEYRKACTRAVSAAQPFHPDATEENAIAFFEGLV